MLFRSGNITLLQGDARTTLSGWQQPLDFLFLDADGESYPLYWELLESAIADGGIFVMDNARTHQEANEKFVQIIRQSSDWLSWFWPVDNGLFLGCKGGLRLR